MAWCVQALLANSHLSAVGMAGECQVDVIGCSVAEVLRVVAHQQLEAILRGHVGQPGGFRLLPGGESTQDDALKGHEAVVQHGDVAIFNMGPVCIQPWELALVVADGIEGRRNLRGAAEEFHGVVIAVVAAGVTIHQVADNEDGVHTLADGEDAVCVPVVEVRAQGQRQGLRDARRTDGNVIDGHRSVS